MSVRIDMTELNQILIIVRSRSRKIGNELAALRRAFEAVRNSNDLQGEVKTAIDNNITQVHIPIIQGLEELHHVLVDTFKDMIRDLQAEIPERQKNAIISVESLRAYRAEVENQDREVLNMNARLKSAYRDLEGLLDVRMPSRIPYDNAVAKLNRNVNRAIGKMSSFSADMSELTNLLTSVNREVGRVANIANRPFTDRINPGNPVFIKDMNKRTQQRQETIARQGVMSGFRGPISILGGGLGMVAGRPGVNLKDLIKRATRSESFINSLKEPLRSAMKSLAGNPSVCAVSGDPVNMSTGNFLYDHVDMKIEGAFPLEFKRFYNSLDSHDGALGKNWCHNYAIDLTETEDGRVGVMYEDGHQEYYSLDESGKYQGSAGIFTRLEKHAGIDEQSDEMDKLEKYTLTFLDGSVYHFNAFGLLTKQVAASGNETNLTYDGQKLLKVENVGGYIEFLYTEDGMIKALVDHTGRRIKYTYESDTLISYTDVLGNEVTHSYDKNKRLVRIVNREGYITFDQVYDEKDRASKQIFSDDNIMGYTYDENKNETTFTWQNGAEITYKRDEQYRTTGIIYPDGEEVITYNDLNQRTSFTDKLGNQTRFEYDEVGNVSKVTNAKNVVTELKYQENSDKLTRLSISGNQKVELEYNENKQLTKAIDATGNATSLSYNEQGLPMKIKQADGSDIHLAYDERGNVTQVTDATGITTAYEYDKLNRVVATIDGNLSRTEFAYDNAGNIIQVKNAQNSTQTFDYNKNNKVTCVTDFNGSVIKREYNTLGKLSKVIDPLERVTSLSYDCMWNVSQVIQPNGAKTEFVYNALNRLETVVKPDGSQIEYEYDPLGNRTGVTDEIGNTTKLEYDALGQLIKVIDAEGNKTSYVYNNEGQVTSVADAMGNTLSLEYDMLGRLVSETNVLGDSRTYTYTALGKIEGITDEAGRTTSYEYGLGGRLQSVIHPDGTNESFIYDGNSNIKTHTNKTGQETSYTYDSLNRVVEILVPNGGKKTYAYDPVGNVTSMADELGNETTYTYTLTGQLEKVIDALGNETHYTYDLLDQLIEVKQLGGIDGTDGIDLDLENVNAHNETNRITIYERNLLGQVTSVTDALGQTERYKYSTTGQLLEKIDKEGYLTQYSYTKLGDVSQVQYSDGKEVAMSYNTLRQLTEIKDWLGTTSNELDPLGRAIKVTDHNDKVVEYAYNALGAKTQMIYPDGRTVNYNYDDNLRLTQINDGMNPVNYSYDEFGRLSEKSFDNGMKTQYQFNTLGQLAELTHFNQNEILDKYVYGYDALGNKTSIEKTRTSLENDSGTYHYTYDPLNRLTEVAKDDNLLRSYDYDVFGNRTSMIENGSETSYTFNKLNQLISSTDGKSFSYDKRGNLTQITKNGSVINAYEFNPMNRLDKAINHETHLSSIYKYNGLNKRVGQIVGDIDLNPTKNIDHVLDLTREYHNLLQRSEDGVINSYTYDFGLLSADGNPYLLDDLGSPVRFGDEVYGYDEFGQPLHDHTSSQPFGFTGYQFDTIAGNYLSPSRAYSPQLGRFTSADTHWNPNNMIYGDLEAYSEVPTSLRGIAPDPLAIGQSTNAYIYTLNNPLIFVDMNGLWITQAIGGAIGAVVGAGSQFVSDLATSAINREWSFSSWETYVGATVGGGAAGVAAGSGIVDPRALGAISAGASTFTTQVLETYVSRRTPDRNFGDILFNTAFDTGTGAALGWVTDKLPLPRINGRSVRTGVGSYDASFISVMTRIRNGNASRIGWRTIRNGFVSMGIGGLPDSILASIAGTNIIESLFGSEHNSLQDVTREWFMGLFDNSNTYEFEFPSCE